MWLKEFANTLPGHAVCDLTSDHLDLYLAQHSDLSAKSRNERPGVVRMFLKWAVERDYLRQDTRLFNVIEYPMNTGINGGKST